MLHIDRVRMPIWTAGGLVWTITAVYPYTTADSLIGADIKSSFSVPVVRRYGRTTAVLKGDSQQQHQKQQQQQQPVSPRAACSIGILNRSCNSRRTIQTNSFDNGRNAHVHEFLWSPAPCGRSQAWSTRRDDGVREGRKEGRKTDRSIDTSI